MKRNDKMSADVVTASRFCCCDPVCILHLQVVVIDVLPNQPLSLHHKFYLLPVSPCTYSGDSSATSEIPRLYMKPGPLTRLDSKALVHAHNLHSLMG